MSILAVTSHKGGTGKSCIAAYTGAALARNGNKVLVLEMGGGMRSVDLILGAQSDIFYDFSDAVTGRCKPADAVLKVEGYPNLSILPCSPFSIREKLPAARCLQVVQELSSGFDWLVLDGVDFSILPPAIVDTILLVTNPDTLSCRASSFHSSELHGAGASNIRLVINNVPAQIPPIPGVADFDDIIDMTGAQLAAVIPQSPMLHFSANHSAALDEDTVTFKVFQSLAARLSGQEMPLLIR